MKQFFILAAAACLILSCKQTPVEQPEKPAVSVTLDKETLSLKTGETETLTATVEPADATDVVVWSSSDEEVAVVEDGVVGALTAGTATITATVDGKSATSTLKVEDVVEHKYSYEISPASATIDIGGTQSYTVTPPSISEAPSPTRSRGSTRPGRTASRRAPRPRP